MLRIAPFLVSLALSAAGTPSFVDTVVAKLELKAGECVADIGAGQGRFTRAMSRVVGDSGKVYAVDLDIVRALPALREIAAKQPNVVPVEGEENSPRLQPNSVDAVLIVIAYHEFRKPEEMLRNIATALKPGGRLLLVEDTPRPSAKTREEQTRSHDLASEIAIPELEKAGFQLVSLDNDVVDSTDRGGRKWMALFRLRDSQPGSR